MPGVSASDEAPNLSRLCVDCVYYVRRDRRAAICEWSTCRRSLVTGACLPNQKPVTCKTMREGGACGPAGKMWLQRRKAASNSGR